MPGWYRKGSAPKREEGRAQREARRKTSTIKMRGTKEAMLRSQNGRMAAAAARTTTTATAS